MCDPVSALVGVGGALVAKKVMSPSASAPASPTSDPEADRQRAEAEAAQRANAKLASDNRRRREQGSLIARGAPQPQLGDDLAGPTSPLISTGGGMVSRRSTAQAASLLSRGAASIGGVGGRAGGVNSLR